MTASLADAVAPPELRLERAGAGHARVVLRVTDGVLAIHHGRHRGRRARCVEAAHVAVIAELVVPMRAADVAAVAIGVGVAREVLAARTGGRLAREAAPALAAAGHGRRAGRVGAADARVRRDAAAARARRARA